MRRTNKQSISCSVNHQRFDTSADTELWSTLLTTCCNHRAALPDPQIGAALQSPQTASVGCAPAVGDWWWARTRRLWPLSIANCSVDREPAEGLAMGPQSDQKVRCFGRRWALSHTSAVVQYRADSDLRSRRLLGDSSRGTDRHWMSRPDIVTEWSAAPATGVPPAGGGDPCARCGLNDHFRCLSKQNNH